MTISHQVIKQLFLHHYPQQQIKFAIHTSYVNRYMRALQIKVTFVIIAERTAHA
jgi:hypothetical protein